LREFSLFIFSFNKVTTDDLYTICSITTNTTTSQAPFSFFSTPQKARKNYIYKYKNTPTKKKIKQKTKQKPKKQKKHSVIIIHTKTKNKIHIHIVSPISLIKQSQCHLKIGGIIPIRQDVKKKKTSYKYILADLIGGDLLDNARDHVNKTENVKKKKKNKIKRNIKKHFSQESVCCSLYFCNGVVLCTLLLMICEMVVGSL